MSELEPTETPSVPDPAPAPAPDPGWAPPDASNDTATAPYAIPGTAANFAPTEVAAAGAYPYVQAQPTSTPTMPIIPAMQQPTPGAPYYGPPPQGQMLYSYVPPMPMSAPMSLTQGLYSPEAILATQKGKRKRIIWTLTAVVAVVAVAAVGIVALLLGRTGNSIVAKVQCRPSDLSSCLINAPAGAVQLSSPTPWSQEAAPSTELYSSTITSDAVGLKSDSTTLLGQDGLHQVVHTDWNAVDGDDIDLVLLQFGSRRGAQAWNSTRTAETTAAYPGQGVAIPGDTAGKAFAATKADAQGDVDAAYSAVVGDLVLNVAYSSPKALSPQDLASWTGTELASLRSAPAAAADPAPVAPSTENLACAAPLGSCLMPMPKGGQRWDSPNDKLWVSSSTLTPAQFIHLGWEGEPSAQVAVTADFNADGVTGIAHEDWATDDADKQADVYLIQTITAAGATALTSTNFGEPDWTGSGVTGVPYTIPNQPDAQAWYTNKTDSDGFIEFYFTATVGNVIVHAWLDFYHTFDTATADSWADSELDLVSHSSTSQPMGLFPLTAPTLPAAGQGACPASGDCLLPLPAGTTDTTSSSYSATENVNAVAYSGQYEGVTSNDVATWLASDGFKGAEHRSWTAAAGAAADAVLLKYGNPAQAKAAAMLEYGDNALGARDCTDSAVPDSLCLATAVSATDYMQEETIWVLAWKGDYEVRVAVTLSNGADVADAYTWMQQQLDLLPAS